MPAVLLARPQRPGFPPGLSRHVSGPGGVTVWNDFENTASGTGVTAGNSASSGSAFDSVVTGTGSILAYDNSLAAHGNQSCKTATASTSTISYITWSTGLSGTTCPRVFYRLCLYLTANPAVQYGVWRAVNGATLCGGVLITTAGKLLVVNTAGSTVSLSTNTIPLNQWFRLEGFLTASATTGQTEVRLYKNVDAPWAAPDEVNLSSAAQNTSATITQLRYGIAVSAANIGPYWQDGIAASTVTYPGPVQSTVAFPADPSSGTTDAAAFAESPEITGITDTDSAAFAELVSQIAVTDTGAAVFSDAATPTTAVTSADTFSVTAESGSAVPSGVSVSDTDAATCTDTTGTLAIYSSPDSAAFSGAATPATGITSTDSALVTDTAVPSAGLSGADAAVFTEAAPQLAVTSADAFSGAESAVRVAPQGTDTAVFAENAPSTALASSDAAVFTEPAPPAGAATGITSADSATTTEAQSAAALVADTDAFTAAESQSAAATVTDSDVLAAGGETASVNVLAAGDPAVFTETTAPQIALASADTLTASGTGYQSGQFFSADSAVFSDAEIPPATVAVTVAPPAVSVTVESPGTLPLPAEAVLDISVLVPGTVIVITPALDGTVAGE